MGNEIWMHVHILYYKGKVSDCFYSESVGETDPEITNISLDKARQLMWELVLAGADREVRINRKDRDIVSVDTFILMGYR